jgi:hypothetical protein
MKRPVILALSSIALLASTAVPAQAAPPAASSQAAPLVGSGWICRILKIC